jgi:hypothetical protein
MERATNERAGRLTSSLNGAIGRLSARLEGAVTEALEVRGGEGRGGEGGITLLLLPVRCCGSIGICHSELAAVAEILFLT